MPTTYDTKETKAVQFVFSKMRWEKEEKSLKSFFFARKQVEDCETVIDNNNNFFFSVCEASAVAETNFWLLKKNNTKDGKTTLEPKNKMIYGDLWKEGI